MAVARGLNQSATEFDTDILKVERLRDSLHLKTLVEENEAVKIGGAGNVRWRVPALKLREV